MPFVSDEDKKRPWISQGTNSKPWVSPSPYSQGIRDSPTRADTSAGRGGYSLPMGYGVGTDGPSRLRLSDIHTPNKLNLTNQRVAHSHQISQDHT